MKHTIVITYVWLLETLKKPFYLFDTSLRIMYLPGFNTFRKYNAKAKAYKEFTRAKRTVPAYREFLVAKQFDRPHFNGLTPNISEIPFTDKENYVKLYSIADRCKDGRIPNTGIIIDESSGSSGTATNWVRGHRERNQNARIIKFGIQHLLGKTPLFVINAFALGPWATGVNVTMSCVRFSKLKSLGPDKAKIINTLKQFGTEHHYLIMGYPPFLKLLVDTKEVDWKAYNITFIFGGESMSECMRDYLIEKGIKRVYSSLGASDLELNLAAENDFTIALRKTLKVNATLREKLLKHTGALPMIFQYNPADFYFESSAEGELIITISRPNYLAPKIRYNIHDRGHIMEMKTLKKVCEDLSIDHLKFPISDLPLLFHYGRADMTVSFFGANINPVDIQEAIYNIKLLADTINSFFIQVIEDENLNKRLIVHLELMQGHDLFITDMINLEFIFFEQLANINQDFRAAQQMLSFKEQTHLVFHAFGKDRFANADIRIKAKYV